MQVAQWKHRHLAWGLGLALALPIGASACGAVGGASVARAVAPAATGTPQPLPDHTRLWILAASHFAQVTANPAVQSLFRRGTVFEPIGPRQSPATALAVMPTEVFHSYRTLLQAIQQHTIAPNVRAILYDNERYPNTPKIEQANPLHYDRLVAALAQQHHWLSICDVVQPDRLSPRLRTPAHEVPPCSIVGLNTVQQSERQAPLYAKLVRHWVAVIHAVRPHAPVVAGISANPAGAPVTAAMLSQAMWAVYPWVNGFWLNVPAPGVGCPHCRDPKPSTLASALQTLDRRLLRHPSTP